MRGCNNEVLFLGLAFIDLFWLPGDWRWDRLKKGVACAFLQLPNWALLVSPRCSDMITWPGVVIFIFFFLFFFQRLYLDFFISVSPDHLYDHFSVTLHLLSSPPLLGKHYTLYSPFPGWSVGLLHCSRYCTYLSVS